METLENTQNQESTNALSSNKNWFSGVSSSRGLIVFILAVLILGSGMMFRESSNKKNNTPNPTAQPTNAPSNTLGLPYTIVYGQWRGGSSLIKAFDLTTNKQYILANFESNIKKVKVKSSSELIFINKTGSGDKGKEISIYEIKNKTMKTLTKAQDGFVIDDFVLSSNKRYLAYWEVSDQDSLLGGKSRIYSVDLERPNIKTLIYDETVGINAPIRYLLGITSDGETVFDSFYPNTGTGNSWLYGMSMSNFDGTKKEDFGSMQNGTYSTLPELSPNEDLIAFAGYDGSMGSGREQALNAPNTVELLNLKTKVREKIQNLTNRDKYSPVTWDRQTGNLVFNIISANPNTGGLYAYDISSKSIKKITAGSDQNHYVTYLSNSKVLVGQENKTTSATGNLGDKYVSSYENFSVYDNTTMSLTKLEISDNFMQFIGIFPSNFFKDAEEITKIEKTLQMMAFELRPTLAKERESRQSDPPKDPGVPGAPPGYDACRDMDPENPYYDTYCLGDPQGCTNREIERIRQLCANDPNYVQCFDYNRNNNMANCMGTPLYLYGKEGESVNVKINKTVYNSKPAYNNGYDITLGKNGLINVYGKVYEKIEYTFLSNKVTPPLNGIVTTKEELKETLMYLALNLGLNTKETTDLVNYGTNNINAPFVYVSFFDDKISKEILPITFNPIPDTYINIVFYFKEYGQKPNIAPKPLEFKTPPLRGIFTAVEVSEIVEKQ